MRRSRLGPAVRAVTVAAGGALIATTAVMATDAGAQSPGDGGRQGAYAAAATARGVPERVLLGVSYLESRWDDHQGASTSGGYGPMHLTDVSGPTPRTAAGPRDGDDPRGDPTRPLSVRRSTPPGTAPRDGAAAPRDGAAVQTLRRASELTGVDQRRLKTDPAANIDAGAALLASYQRDLGGPTGAKTDPGQWYAAVARYSGAGNLATATVFADEVFDVIAKGASRRTNDGHAVRLAAGTVRPDRSNLAALRLADRPRTDECPTTLACEWVPAPYELLGDGTDATNYRSYDKGLRPDQQKIEYIVIHDIEGDYDAALGVLRDPTAWTSWHYTVRGTDGGVAQHVKNRDVAWQAGNWYLNTKSIGVEHEGYAADGTWYTETLYRSSAKLVKYLAHRYGVKLDRAHVIGHDNVPALRPSRLPGMHTDPGPYWDWDHYLTLLGAPLGAPSTASHTMVMIKPDYASATAAFTGCPQGTTDPCVGQGVSTVLLRTAPSQDAPLLADPGLHRDTPDPAAPTTMDVLDLGARVSTGQRYAVAETSGDWIAIWYNGRRGWFRSPASAPTAVWVTGRAVTPKAGRSSVAVYGGAFAEDSAYPAGVTPGDTMLPLSDYVLAAGQRYSVAGTVCAESYRAKTFDGSQPGDWTVVRGTTRYVQIQFGHRIGFVDAADVDIV